MSGAPSSAAAAAAVLLLLLLVAAPVLLPEYRAPQRGRFDLVSAAISIATVLPVIYGVKKLAEDGPAVVPVVSIVVGLALGTVFVHRQRVLADPLIDIGLFRRSAFSASIGAYVVFILASAGIGMLVVQYLQLVLDYRPFTGALWMLPMAASVLVGAALAALLVRWIRPGFVVGAGLGLGAIGFAAYRNEVAGAVPVDAPPEAAEAVRATLGGAAAVADQLPAGPAGALLAAAQEAFASGIALTAAVGAGLMAAAAALATVLLRDLRG